MGAYVRPARALRPPPSDHLPRRATGQQLVSRRLAAEIECASLDDDGLRKALHDVNEDTVHVCLCQCNYNALAKLELVSPRLLELVGEMRDSPEWCGGYTFAGRVYRRTPKLTDAEYASGTFLQPFRVRWPSARVADWMDLERAGATSAAWIQFLDSLSLRAAHGAQELG